MKAFRFLLAVCVMTAGTAVVSPAFAAGHPHDKIDCYPLPDPQDLLDDWDFLRCGCSQWTDDADYNACTDYEDSHFDDCLDSNGNGNLTCFVGQYGLIAQRPWESGATLPQLPTNSCMSEERNANNFDRKRESAEHAYDKASGHLDTIGRKRQQALLNVIKRISVQEGLMTSYMTQAGLDVGSTVLSRFTCANGAADFCTTHKSQFALLAKRYATAFGKRNALMMQLSTVERSQMGGLARYYNGTLKAKYNDMVTAYTRRNDGERTYWRCLGTAYSLTVPDPTPLTPPAIACFPAPVVRTGNCFTLPFLGGVYCAGNFWCENGGCTPPANIDPSLLCQDAVNP
jgi:hypothetical protein